MKQLLFFSLFLLSNLLFSQSLNDKDSNLVSNNQFIYFGIVLILIFLVGWQYLKRVKTDKKSDDITNETVGNEEEMISENINEQIEDQDKNYYISSETAALILKKLVKFERDHKYLKKDITLTWVANHLGTNTKYLSETIKLHRGKNFNNYINGLRINYITYMLYKKPEYREYKVVSLAKECGYSSSQVFVIAFKKENGIPPSYFIANLKNENTEPNISSID